MMTKEAPSKLYAEMTRYERQQYNRTRLANPVERERITAHCLLRYEQDKWAIREIGQEAELSNLAVHTLLVEAGFNPRISSPRSSGLITKRDSTERREAMRNFYQAGVTNYVRIATALGVSHSLVCRVMLSYGIHKNRKAGKLP